MGSKAKRQVAALPVRRRKDGGLEVCLVTTRETRRWVIPKGWPEKGLKDWQAAEHEAFEEAGLKGRITKAAVGSFPYWKRMDDHFVLVEVDVYVLAVEKQLTDWAEMAERERRWLDIAEAAEEVLEPGLITILGQLDEIMEASGRVEITGKVRGSPIPR
jgi:8-oxo-dGTP pyrophosphatase MutT (NUDIX family)